jgi:hypothetical protein
MKPVPFWVGFALTTALAWAPSRAHAEPAIRVQVDADTVAVGDTVHLQMSASSSDAPPSDPRLASTGGFLVHGPNISTGAQIDFANGIPRPTYTLTVEWALEAQRAGTFSVGPPSAIVSRARVAGNAVTVHVVPPGKAPRRRAPAPQQQRPSGFPFPMFDPWQGLFPNFPDINPQPPAVAPVGTDPKLALAAPRGEYAFLHATLSKTAAVVGEQVTFNVYVYLNTAVRSVVDRTDSRAPAVSDFVRQQLVADARDDLPLVGYADVGGEVWKVGLLYRWALFPLREGDLVIGPTSVAVAQPASSNGNVRTSETLHVAVTEPPGVDRPPGFATGNVGRFTLRAQVQPREVEQGGAVGVHVELEGTGNMPSTVMPPVREGVEWLAPDVHDELGPKGEDNYGGKRWFDFVVRLQRAGSVNLGELTLPFWDPEARKYSVARAALGSVNVARSAAAAGVSEAAPEPLAGLPAPRRALEGMSAPRRHWADSPLFWIAGLCGGPLLFVGAVSARALGVRAARTWRSRRASPIAELKERVTAARSACAGEDARVADAATARALEAATVAHAGISVRGALGVEIAHRLEQAGVGPKDAMRVADLLRECESARFAPDASDVLGARERWIRAEATIRSLERTG